MSAHAAIAPAAEMRVRRTSAIPVGVHVEDLGREVVEGRPANRVDPWVESAWPGGCPGREFGVVYSSVFIWCDSRVIPQIPPVGHVPLTLVDVDGQTIAIEIWAGGDHVDRWLPTADKIVDSIRFLYRPPDETTPARSTTSP